MNNTVESSETVAARRTWCAADHHLPVIEKALQGLADRHVPLKIACHCGAVAWYPYWTDEAIAGQLYKIESVL